MKSLKYLAISGVFLALVACGASTTTLKYEINVALPDASKAGEVLKASERVVNRRLAGADVADALVTMIPTSSGSAHLTLELPNAEAVEAAERILADGFSFDMRIEVPKTSADGTPAESEWIDTGLDYTTLTWISPVNFMGTQEVGVELLFNEKGREILKTVFASNTGKHLGIFVRELLVSKMQIQKSVPADHIVISGIPSAKIAEIFSDDVNVGLYATFTPAR